MQESSVPVLIAGGGPCGLMLANELGRRGIGALLVDEKPSTAFNPQANATQARTTANRRRRVMRRSTDRILTTHAGSLPRPDALRDAWSKPSAGPQDELELDDLLRSSVKDVVKAQSDAGVDVPNDGEFGKPMRAASDLAAWGTYIFGRISGFGATPPGGAAPDEMPPGQPMRIVGRRWEMREFSEFYASGSLVPTVASRPAASDRSATPERLHSAATCQSQGSH